MVSSSRSWAVFYSAESLPRVPERVDSQLLSQRLLKRNAHVNAQMATCKIKVVLIFLPYSLSRVNVFVFLIIGFQNIVVSDKSFKHRNYPNFIQYFLVSSVSFFHYYFFLLI